MSLTIVRSTNRPACTFNLLDPITRKVIVTAVADSKGVVTLSNIPAGQWIEQVVYSITDSGAAKTVTTTAPTATDFQTAQAGHGPLVTSPDGHVWQINVSNVGALTATSIA